MQRLFGRLVLIAVVVFGIWYVLGHYHGASRFGCSASDAVAHADSSDCPANIGAAASDRQWAANRYQTIKDQPVTTGQFYDQDGTETTFTSGEDSDADRLNQILHAAGVAFPRRSTVHPASSHVETKAAARMRDNNVTNGVIVINNAGGVCGVDGTGPYGCAQVLPVVLPHGATLVVWWPGPSGMTSARFTGQ